MVWDLSADDHTTGGIYWRVACSWWREVDTRGSDNWNLIQAKSWLQVLFVRRQSLICNMRWSEHSTVHEHFHAWQNVCTAREIMAKCQLISCLMCILDIKMSLGRKSVPTSSTNPKFHTVTGWAWINDRRTCLNTTHGFHGNPSFLSVEHLTYLCTHKEWRCNIPQYATAGSNAKFRIKTHPNRCTRQNPQRL